MGTAVLRPIVFMHTIVVLSGVQGEGEKLGEIPNSKCTAPLCHHVCVDGATGRLAQLGCSSRHSASQVTAVITGACCMELLQRSPTYNRMRNTVNIVKVTQAAADTCLCTLLPLPVQSSSS